MKSFTTYEIEEAIAYAASGGQALHLHQFIVNWDKAPSCFVREVKAGRDIAHLFDQDYARLIKTCRQLGVKVILVEREGTERQHIDLCGVPLRKAVAMAEADQKEQGLLAMGDDL